jgi:Domain of unknown function (DUF4328)
MSEPTAPDAPVPPRPTGGPQYSGTIIPPDLPPRTAGGPQYAGTIVPRPAPVVAPPAAPPVRGSIRAVRVAGRVATVGLGSTIVANLVVLLAVAASTGPLRATPGLVDIALDASVIRFLGTIVSAFAFITWLYLAMRNIKRWGITGLTWSPVWAIVGWLIPLANLVIPPLVVNAADKGSSASVRGGVPESASAGLIGAWWLTLLFGGRLDRAASALYPPAMTITYSLAVSVLAALASVIAAMLGIVLVRRVTTAQVYRQHSLDTLDLC